jgi:hypothetical protein
MKTFASKFKQNNNRHPGKFSGLFFLPSIENQAKRTVLKSIKRKSKENIEINFNEVILR